MDMDKKFKKNLLEIPIKIIAVIIAFMILLRFAFLFYDFIKSPFHEPATLSGGSEAVKHVMSGLILLELFALTIRFLIQEMIDPNLIILTVLTALGRDLIVLDIAETDFPKILAIGFIFAVAILGIYVLKKCGPQCELRMTDYTEMRADNKITKGGDEGNMVD
jgi:uncharacterized membrane protein (DUF373 family)